MKYLLGLLFVFTNANVFASESSTHFLSEEAFKSLSREDQALYIRTVQRILAAMSKQTLFMAESEGPRDSRMPASLLTDKSTSKGTTALLENQLALDKKIQELTQSVSSKEKAAIDLVDPFMEERRPVTPSSSPKVAAVVVVAAPSPVPVPVPAPSPAPAPQAAKAPTPTPQKPPESPKKKPASTTTEKSDKKETKARENYRCMYAGWVVTKHPCKGVNKLPTGWEIDGTDASKMTCEDSKTMCNPFVFGLRLEKPCTKIDEKDCSRKATPICVNKGAWPTESCYKESTFEDALVAADIQGTIAPTKFNTYKQLFNDLCDKDQIEKNPFADPKNRPNKKVSAEAVKRDISITCAWANKKLELATEAFNIRASGGKAADKKKWSEDKAKADKEFKTQK